MTWRVAGNEPERVQLAEVWGVDVGGWSGERMVELVEEVAAEGRWLVLVFHGVQDTHRGSVNPTPPTRIHFLGQLAAGVVSNEAQAKLFGAQVEPEHALNVEAAEFGKLVGHLERAKGRIWTETFAGVAGRVAELQEERQQEGQARL